MKRKLFFGLAFFLIGIFCGYFVSQTVNVTTRDPVKVYTGYLVCQACAGADRGIAADGADVSKHPEKHTVSCLKMYTCVTSGFGLFIKNKDGNYTYYKFDQKGSDLAYKNIVSKTTKIDNLLVEVTGTIRNNILLINSISEK